MCVYKKRRTKWFPIDEIMCERECLPLFVMFDFVSNSISVGILTRNPHNFGSTFYVLSYQNRFSRANRNSIEWVVRVYACKLTWFWLHQTEIYFMDELEHSKTDKSGLKNNYRNWNDGKENQWKGKRQTDRKETNGWMDGWINE